MHFFLFVLDTLTALKDKEVIKKCVLSAKVIFLETTLEKGSER